MYKINILNKKLQTPIGEVSVCATDKGICLLVFSDCTTLNTKIEQIEKELNGTVIPGTNPYIDQLEMELQEYFNGSRKTFSVPLVISGTPFQKKAWNALLKIPYGEIHSYKEQAGIVGNTRLARAVGGANRTNRIWILIPCHRIVGSDKKLTGYAGGIWRKEYLLKLEQNKKS